MATVSKTAVEKEFVASPWLLVPLLLLYFLSGISGLIYEVVWFRMLALVFGVTIYAVSAVLASFMAGLALGSYLAGRIADRHRSPLLLYGLIEFFIGLIGLLSPLAMEQLVVVYKEVYTVFAISPPLLNLVRFLAACMILLVPTTLMGATLPLIVKASLSGLRGVGGNVSLLYAYNTGGAVVGTMGAGFLLIGNYGMQSAILVAASLNGIAGLGAVIVAQFLPKVSFQPLSLNPKLKAINPSPFAPFRTDNLVFLAFGLSGFCALAYEVIWFRMLDIFLNGTVYAFSLMLAIFLTGLAVGSLFARLFIGRRANWLAVFGLLEFLIGLMAILSIVVIGKVPPLRELMATLPYVGEILARPMYFMALASSIILLPTTILLGITFPVAAQVVIEDINRAGAKIGNLNAANTVGAIMGSLVGGFYLISALGSQKGLLLLGSINLGVALVILWLSTYRLAAKGVFTAMALAVILMATTAMPDMYTQIFRGHFKGFELVWYEEGLENTVSVQRNKEKVLHMFLNSRVQTFDNPGMVSFHRLLGLLPMLIHPDPKDVLVIGLGGGATPGAMSLFEDSQIDIIELSPSVIKAAGFFQHINYNVVQRSNVRLAVDDGRNYLLLTSKRYDVIAADLIEPHHAGSGNLYSVEYFRLARDALKEGGIMAQWVSPTWGPPQYKMVMRTFLEVFPYVTLWYGGNFILGSKEPMKPDGEELEKKLRIKAVREAADGMGLGTSQAILGLFTSQRDDMLRFVGPGPLVTDNQPYTEYFRSLSRAGIPSIP